MTQKGDTTTYKFTIPSLTPWTMPEAPFNELLNKVGVNLLWMKSKQCPCTYGGNVPGSPDSRCNTCKGRGIYWEDPVGPFLGGLTFIHTAMSPDELSSQGNETAGQILKGEPTLSIPHNAPYNIWDNASIYDAYVEIDAKARYNVALKVGEITALPYKNGATVAAAGAVTIYDQAARQAVVVNTYTFDGTDVVLTGYPEGTAYNVEYTAAPVYIAFGKTGGMPHVRPFGGNIVNLPKRFRLKLMDLWIRSKDGAMLP